jgi:hypothetical protein
MNQPDTDIRNAVLGNVGLSLPSLRTARCQVFNECYPVFKSNDFTNLENYEIYLKLVETESLLLPLFSCIRQVSWWLLWRFEILAYSEWSQFFDQIRSNSIRIKHSPYLCPNTHHLLRWKTQYAHSFPAYLSTAFILNLAVVFFKDPAGIRNH